MKITLSTGLRALAVLGLIALAAPLALAQAPAQNGGARQGQWQGRHERGGHGRDPRIHQGIRLLDNARRVLNHGAHDFGGHRTAAIQQIDQGLKNLQLALQVKHNNPEQGRNGNGSGGHNGNGRWRGRHYAENGGGGGYGNYGHRGGNGQNAHGNEAHPDIRHGLKLCMRAKDVLDHAAHDYDGHRAAAVQNVNQAIAQLRQALQYDKH